LLQQSDIFHAIRLTFQKKEQMERLPDEILRVHQHVDILINNAGVALAGAFETGKARVLVGRDTFMLVDMLFSRSAG
jgi:NADP-dependent 3-hydroxy acid dehydrogenase YdfG